MKLLIATFIIFLASLTSCGLPTNSPDPFPQVETATVLEDTIGTIDTIVLSDDYTEDTTSILVTNTYFSIINPYFKSETHEEVKRLVIEWEEGEVTFCKLNNTVMYADADRKVSHEYTYSGANTIIVRKNNTLEGIARDHNTTVSNLKALNPGLGKILIIGKSIKIK